MVLSPPQFHLLEASAFGDSTYSEVDALFGCAAHSEQPAEQTIVDSAPIPKQSRVLPDTKGKLSESVISCLCFSLLVNSKQSTLDNQPRFLTFISCNVWLQIA